MLSLTPVTPLPMYINLNLASLMAEQETQLHHHILWGTPGYVKYDI